VEGRGSPLRGAGSGVGGGRKAAMLAAVQSLRLVGVLPVQGVRLGWGAGWVGVEKAAMLAAVQSLRLGWGWWGYYQFRRLGWVAGWVGSKSCDARSSPKPSAGLVGVLPVQSLRLELGSGLGGVEKAAMLAAVQSLRLVGYYQSGPSAGLWLMGGRTILG
jgi:hypothetical protein